MVNVFPARPASFLYLSSSSFFLLVQRHTRLVVWADVNEKNRFAVCLAVLAEHGGGDG